MRTLLLALPGFALGGLATAQQSSLPPTQEGMRQTLTWGDVDGDGLEDLYVARAAGNDQLFRNAGTGALEDVTQGALPPLTEGSLSASLADVDGDDHLDLVLLTASGRLRLLRNDGLGGFRDAAVPELSALAGIGSLAWRDYDADGLEDLQLTLGGSEALFRNESGDATIRFRTIVAPEIGPAGTVATAPTSLLPTTESLAATARSNEKRHEGRPSTVVTTSATQPLATRETARPGLLVPIAGAPPVSATPIDESAEAPAPKLVAAASGTDEIQSATTILNLRGQLYVNGSAVIDETGTWVGPPTTKATTGVTGGVSDIDLRQPSLSVNFIISLNGTDPSDGVASGQNPYLGEIRLLAGNDVPAGWDFCRGQLVDPTTYPSLFANIGTTYGGDGVSTFGLPDLRGRVPLGPGQGAGLSNYFRGQTVGMETENLSIGQMPSHTHSLE